MKFFEKRIDPLTGEEFFPKRKNQKFANPANQIKFNNRQWKLKKEAAIKQKKELERKIEANVIYPFPSINKPFGKSDYQEAFAAGFFVCAVVCVVVLIYYKKI